MALTIRANRRYLQTATQPPPPVQARRRCFSEFSHPSSRGSERYPQRNNPETFEDIIQKYGVAIGVTCGCGPAEDRQRCPPCPPRYVALPAAALAIIVGLA